MKTLLSLLTLVCLLPVRAEDGPVSQAKERARSQFESGLEVIRGIYRRSISELIGSGTRVELYLLDWSFGEEKRPTKSVGSFEIEPYRKSTGVLATHTCTEAERDELLPLLSTAIAGFPHDGGMACHYPIHGVRVWIGDEKVFETSICWYCGNYMMDYGRGQGWENHTDGFRALKPVVHRLMPIPEDEVRRFKRDHQ